MRRAAKRDTSEPAIVKALKAVGATVYQISGKAFPDLLIQRAGVWYVCEVKSTEERKIQGKGRYRKDRLTPAQQLAGIEHKWPIVRSVDEALAVVGCTR